MFDVITIGGATRDVFFDTSEGQIINDKESESGKLLAFEYGAKIIPEKVSFCYGGGGLNTAISFSRLGLNVASLINIGKEGTGNLILKELEKEKVDTSLVTKDVSAHTSLSVIISKDKDHTMFLYRDANNNLMVNDWDALKSTKWIYLSSLSGDSEKIIKELPAFLNTNGIKLAWNPGSKQIDSGLESLKELVSKTEVLIMNKAEARELISHRGQDISNEKELLKSLKELGPKVVVITDGANGSYVLGDEYTYQPSLSSNVLETTGAGDSYGSTFVAALIKGSGLDIAANLAATNSASVISKIGAHEGLLTQGDLFKESKNVHQSV